MAWSDRAIASSRWHSCHDWVIIITRIVHHRWRNVMRRMRLVTTHNWVTVHAHGIVLRIWRKMVWRRIGTPLWKRNVGNRICWIHCGRRCGWCSFRNGCVATIWILLRSSIFLKSKRNAVSSSGSIQSEDGFSIYLDSMI